MRKRVFIEETEGEEYLHKETWRVVKRQFERADENKPGAMYDCLVAMVFAYHTLEGYLNFIGDKTQPDIWKNEREEFRKDGIMGKLTAILKVCELETFIKGRRPHSTIQTLRTLRDTIAHPRIHRPKTSTVYSDGKKPPLFREIYLETLVSSKKAARARDDVQYVVERIHAAAVMKFPDLRLGADGLEGILSMRTSFSRHQERSE